MSQTTLTERGPTGGRPTKLTCRHCGAPLLDERMRSSGFCCSGCAYVHRLVHEHGLDAYYRLKDTITVPADPAVFQTRDYSWLVAAQAAATKTELELSIQGVSCVGCVWLIEQLFSQQPGARDLFLNPQYGTLRLRWIGADFRAADFARKLQAFGYLVGPADPERSKSEASALVGRVGLCAAFALNVMLFTLPVYFGMEKSFAYARLFALLSLTFASLSFLVGGGYFLARAWQALRLKVLHIDLPIALGIAGAYAGSVYGWLTGEPRFVYFDFVATFIFLMLVGRWAQVASVERNRRRLLGLQPRLQPLAIVGGGEVRPEQVKCGAVLSVHPGQIIPVAARLRGAQGLFSLASINGEPQPRLIREGQPIPAGAVNVGQRPVEIEAREDWGQSLLARLLVPGERPGWRHRFLEQIVRGYLVAIIVLAIAAGIGWWTRTHDAPRTWSVVTAVLVVSCPCAIGLAFPLADEMATLALRRRGVFVREGDLWAKLADVKKIAFDKTGTLTLELPVLINPEALLGLAGPARAALLGLVQDNPHPVSACLLEHLLAAGAVAPLAGPVDETIGFGLALGPWTLGRPGWRTPAPENGLPAGFCNFGCDGVVVVRFQFRDEARPEVRAELAELQRQGYATYILSGDDSQKVCSLAQGLGVPMPQALGGLTPQDKADWLDRLGAGEVLMLGDGANDSLAFDRALCRGTPVIHRGILESKADFFYLGRGIGGIRALFRADAVRRRTHHLILAFSIVYNVLAVGLAIAGHMSPLIAAVLMPANSLLTLALVGLGMRPILSESGRGKKPRPISA